SAEEWALVLEARQAVERDLDRVGQDVESLEAVDTRSALPEPAGENPGIEQIEDARGVGEEAVLARAGEDRLTGGQAEHGLACVLVERGERGGPGHGPSVGVVVEGGRARAHVRWRRQETVPQLEGLAPAVVLARRAVRGDPRHRIGLHEVL